MEYNSEGAIKQIRDINYPKVFTNYGGRIVLVGIYYEEDKKTHERIIEEYRKQTDRLICISRPRRFGKSYAAQMLCAY